MENWEVVVTFQRRRKKIVRSIFGSFDWTSWKISYGHVQRQYLSNVVVQFNIQSMSFDNRQQSCSYSFTKKRWKIKGALLGSSVILTTLPPIYFLTSNQLVYNVLLTICFNSKFAGFHQDVKFKLSYYTSCLKVCLILYPVISGNSPSIIVWKI